MTHLALLVPGRHLARSTFPSTVSVSRSAGRISVKARRSVSALGVRANWKGPHGRSPSRSTSTVPAAAARCAIARYEPNLAPPRTA